MSAPRITTERNMVIGARADGEINVGVAPGALGLRVTNEGITHVVELPPDAADRLAVELIRTAHIARALAAQAAIVPPNVRVPAPANGGGRG